MFRKIENKMLAELSRSNEAALREGGFFAGQDIAVTVLNRQLLAIEYSLCLAAWPETAYEMVERGTQTDIVWLLPRE